jgi:general secretion pathway protein N
MQHRTLLIGVGVTCFIAFVLVSLPARFATALLPADLVQMSGVSGTLWNGRARIVRVAGNQLTSTRWTLQPWQLALGRLAMSLHTEWLGIAASGNVAVGLTGAITARDVEMFGPLGPLTRRMNIPQSGGELAVQFDKLAIKDAWPRSAVGSVRIGNLPLNIIGVAAGPVGTYEVSFTAADVPDDGRFVGELRDLGGPLQLGGEIAFSPPRNYELNALIKATPGAPPDLVRGLALLGPADAQGRHELVMSGSF